jgi:hypothetical protein
LNPERSVLAYLVDPLLARTATGFASQMMLAATTQFRFQQPMVHLLSKGDLLDEASLETIRAWAAEPEALEHDVLAEAPSMSREFAAHMARLLESLGLERNLVPVSSQSREGLADLYALVQASVGGSAEATPEYDTFLRPDQADLDLN